jgi:hypothetical protein
VDGDVKVSGFALVGHGNDFGSRFRSNVRIAVFKGIVVPGKGPSGGERGARIIGTDGAYFQSCGAKRLPCDVIGF